MQKTFLFYDLETSGINKCFDQIFQFAAIRTDLDLNELERHEFLVKLNPDTIPDPQATIVHHLSISELNKNGISEYEAVKKIHGLVNTPGTISLGYNTLGFDDEFLRFSFHRNLLTPYTHQFANDCSRMDIYPLVPIYYLFVNECLKWPMVDGKVSFKLENLNEENKLHIGGRAHDAIVDIEVTIALAKKLKEHGKVWDYLLGNFNKQTDQKRFNALKGGLEIDGVDYKQSIMVNGIFGYDKLFHVPVLHLGQHKSYKNQECFLRLDMQELRELTEENIEDNFIWPIKKKWAESPMILPANSKYASKLGSERLNEIALNKKWISENTAQFEQLKEFILTHKYPEYENIDSDANLYSLGFPSKEEQLLLNKFHQSDFEGKVEVLDELSSKLRSRAVRLISRNALSYLPYEYQDGFQCYLENVTSYDIEDLPLDFKGKRRRCLTEVFESIEVLKDKDLTDEQLQLIDEIDQYIS
jgi:exodeoxyribonuclease-1